MVFLMTPNCVDAQGFLNKIGKALDKVGKVIDTLPSESSSKNSSSSSNNNSSSTSSRTYTTKQGGMTISVVHRNLKIEIKRCEAAGNTVVVDFMIENAGGNDADLRVWGGNRSTAYDDEGNVYKGGALQIKYGNSGLANWDVNGVLPSGIPLKGRIQIEGVPESITTFSRIDILMESNAWDFHDKITKITNIPISRDGDE